MAVVGVTLHAQGSAPRAGVVEHVKVHGKSLEGNLEGDSPDRDVTIYLPPSYAAERTRRYPVVYLLHGYGGTDTTFNGRLAKLPEIADRLAAVVDDLRQAGARSLSARFVPTARNAPAADFLPRHGFHEERGSWRADVSDVPGTPSHVTAVPPGAHAAPGA